VQREVVDTAERLEAVLPDIYLMTGQGLIELQDVEVVKYTGAEPPARPSPPPDEKVTMKAKQMWIHVSEKDVHEGEPLYEAIVKRFNAEEFAGVTVYKAFEGFGSHHQIYRDRWFTLHREAPMVLIMVDTEEHIAKARAILDRMLTHGAVV